MIKTLILSSVIVGASVFSAYGASVPIPAKKPLACWDSASNCHEPNDQLDAVDFSHDAFIAGYLAAADLREGCVYMTSADVQKIAYFKFRNEFTQGEADFEKAFATNVNDACDIAKTFTVKF